MSGGIRGQRAYRHLVALGEEEQRQFEALAARIGEKRLAALVGASFHTVGALRFGGFARPHVVERISEALRTISRAGERSSAVHTDRSRATRME